MSDELVFVDTNAIGYAYAAWQHGPAQSVPSE
jgi:hypothetical protein